MDSLAAHITLDASGGSTLGYVYTRYGKRSLADVKRDVRRYFDWYQPDGIFIDEMAPTATKATLHYYAALASYIRAVYPQAIIVDNPGTAFSPADAQESAFLSGRHIQWVYSTTLGARKTDPYAALPADFEQEVAALVAVDSAH